MTETKSYGRIAYERFHHWKTGSVERPWDELSIGEQDDWTEAAFAVINAYNGFRNE